MMNKNLFLIVLCIFAYLPYISYSSDKLELIPKKESSSTSESEEIEVYVAINPTDKIKRNKFLYKKNNFYINKLKNSCSPKAQIFFGCVIFGTIIILFFMLYKNYPQQLD